MDIDRTVLIIDGENGLRAVLAAALAHRGYKVLQAGSGAQASTIAATEPLHLIVLGSRLQDTDGVMWLGAVREHGNRVRVIFLSENRPTLESAGKLAQELLARELDVSLVLHRLLDPEVLSEQVERLVGRSRLPLPLYQSAERAERLAALGASYGRRLPAKLDELAQAIAAVCVAPDERAPREAARFLSNRIRSTAGSYGFASVGDQVRYIERVLDSLVTEGPEAAVAACRVIEEALAAAWSLLTAHPAGIQLPTPSLAPHPPAAPPPS